MYTNIFRFVAILFLKIQLKLRRNICYYIYFSFYIYVGYYSAVVKVISVTKLMLKQVESSNPPKAIRN